MPKVSVIIPVYNVEKYLKRALDSVINQTLKDIEIICIDDKSSDNSLKILEEYARTYANIKIIRFSRNKGVAKARNEGIKLATGEYIAFLDPDDYVDTNFYEELYNVTITKDVDIVKGGKKTIDISGNTKDSTLNQLASQNKYNFTYEFWTALYKTSFIKCNNFDFPENIINGEDCVFLLKCILNTDKIEIINEVYYYYCKRIDSLNTHFLSLSSILSSINSVKERLLYINNSKLYNYDKNSYIYVFNQHLSMHIWNYYQCKSFVAKYLFSKSIITFYYLCKDTNMLSKIINRKDILKFIKKRNVLELELYLNNEIKNNITQTPIYSSGYIPIVLASDENQCKQMYITILSALSNKKKKSFYDFFLLVPELFPKTILKQFKKFEKKYSNCRINFIEMGNCFSKLEMRISHITTPTYYRLKIADVLPDNYKKAIYLDTDVIVLKDLAEFFNTDLSNYYIAGVKAAGYIINTDNRKYYEEIGISDLSNYINAGVTLWNLDKIRSDNMTELMLKLARNNYKSQDQDVINIAFFGHIKILSARYNLMTKYEKGFLYKSTSYAERLKNIYSEDNFENLISNTLIIHYADKIKPWNDSEIWLGHYWWKYAQKSRLFKRQQNIMSKYFQNIFSVKNDNIHKVITILGLKIKFKSKKLIKRKAGIKEVPYTFLENVFSVKNINIHKVITILGIKMKFKSQKLIERQRINNLENLIKKTLSELQEEKKNNQLNANKLKEQNIEIQKILKEQQEAFTQQNNELKNELKEQQEVITQQNNELKNTQINMELRITNNIQDLNKKLDAFHDAQDQNKLTFTNNFQNIEKYLHNYIDNQNKNKNLYTIKSNFELERCKEFYEDIDKISYIKKYKALINNLDPESIECVSKILSRVEHAATKGLPMDVFDENEKKRLEILNKDFYPNILKLNDDCYAYQKYLLPIKHFESSVFYYKHNIDNLKDLIKIRNKNIIDAGGFIGDSAIILKDYTDKKVFSFEPTSENYELLLKTIEYNDCHEKIIPIKQALGSCEQELEINIQSSGSSINRIIQENPSKELIKVDTLDKFVEDNALDIGLIKVDIEGFEQEFINGALNTIKNQKPTLLISIYHFADDFFNIKPFIESLNLGYSFKVIKPIDGGIRGEILLICEQ